MAKIFRTQELSVNGDNIRISADQNGNIVFKDKDENVVTSSNQITTEVSSLHAQRDGDLNTKNTEVSSLAAQRDSDLNTKNTEVSSLHAQRVSDESVKTGEMSSLSAKDLDLDGDVSSLKVEINSALTASTGDLDNDISSLNAKIELEDVRVMSESLSVNDESITVTFPTAFSGTPSVIGIIQGDDADSPIIACQLVSKSTTGATFQFSDGIPTTGYTIEIMASV